MLGGLSPLAATWLVHRTGIDLSPAFIVMAVGRDLLRRGPDVLAKPIRQESRR